ncbi:hypothetical protein Brsp01_44370 [Brucella sp. NBRC 12950]|nr:hypothetical protein Brsp01_44370 [Brucella sp. NBRC 12950]
MVFDDQSMTMPATHCAQDGRATTQSQWVDEIKYVLEESWIASLIDRTADYQSITMLDLRNQTLRLPVQRLSVDGVKVWSCIREI